MGWGRGDKVQVGNAVGRGTQQHWGHGRPRVLGAAGS